MSEMNSDAPTPAARDGDGPVEPDRIAVVPFTVTVLAGALAVVGSVLFVQSCYPERPTVVRFADRPRPPEPRLQIDPRADLLRMRAYERRTLETPDPAGLGAEPARIPISRAMQLVLEEQQLLGPDAGDAAARTAP